MQAQALGSSGLQASVLALGCWRIDQLQHADIIRLLESALAAGINLFDHADIYGQGKSESNFAAAITDMGVARDKLILQSKCGIRQGYYDSSKQHILDSVDGILARLNTDYLDTLLLHRPDALMQPEEIGAAFSALKASGKVRQFGVSNHRPMQIELLKKHLDVPLIINQVQFGLAHTGLIDAGINANTRFDGALDRNGDVLDYSRLNGITLQAWSPMQFGMFAGNFIGHPDFMELNHCLNNMAQVYGCSPSAIAIAWILRHPAKIHTILGTTNPTRLAELCQASDISLSREHWYELYRAAGNHLP